MTLKSWLPTSWLLYLTPERLDTLPNRRSLVAPHDVWNLGCCTWPLKAWLLHLTPESLTAHPDISKFGCPTWAKYKAFLRQSCGGPRLDIVRSELNLYSKKTWTVLFRKTFSCYSRKVLVSFNILHFYVLVNHLIFKNHLRFLRKSHSYVLFDEKSVRGWWMFAL